MSDPLEIFHTLIRQWFREQVGTPTEVQELAWPEIAAGRHALVAAPTGTGKTLTAFLWALQQLIVGHWPPGLVRVLYVSPLKALNNDIRRNLLAPLHGIRQVFREAGEPYPEIRVQTRSGDTQSSERQAMVRRPPQILITTPESLNLMLSAPKARLMFRGVQTVILDEIHAVAGTKRGTHLMTAVERLVSLAGEFQRIALSATVKPMQTVADFVGGYEYIAERREELPPGPLQRGRKSPPSKGGWADVATDDGTYRKRAVRTIQCTSAKSYAIAVRTPANQSLRTAQGARWPFYADALRRIIARNRTTLIFTNNRRLCERLAMLLNDAQEETIAYAHHGSLSKEMREVIEQRLKDGQLAAIVATSSLEMGIDIGDLDEVVLVETPFTIASAVQRIGRAGHRVGEVSRAVVFPTHGRDFLYAAALAPAVLEHDVEPIAPVKNPLDVLAQVIVSMVAVETWKLDELYAILRTAYAFHDLPRAQFDAVIGMLAGRYQHARVRALDPVVSVDALEKSIRGAAPARSRVYGSGGTIPDRGLYNLRLADSRAKIGELDEEFVWERRLGETFTLGTQAWRIQQITHNDVLVAPVKGRPLMVPFWKNEGLNRRAHFSERLANFLEEADRRLDDADFRDALQREHMMDEVAADELLVYLRDQRDVTRVPLPHAHHVVIEHNRDLAKAEATTQTIIHTMWGGTLNRPFALALAQAWEDAYGEAIDVFVDNDTLVLVVPPDAGAPDPFALVPPAALEALLRKRLERSGFFGARFRENAARALLLPRQSFTQRVPLWWNRQRSQKLLEAVREFEDFPIITETWRTCIQDEFELEALREKLRDIKHGAIKVSRTSTVVPSPFCESILWRQTNTYMYLDDTPASDRISSLREDVLKEMVFRDDLRPRIPPAIAEEFRRKIHRVYEDYAPGSPEEVLDWLKERQYIPEREWEELLAAVARDGGPEAPEIVQALGSKALRVEFEGTAAVLPAEQVAFFLKAFNTGANQITFRTLSGDAAALTASEGPDDALDLWLGQWLRFYGPVDASRLRDTLPLPDDALMEALEDLLTSQSLVMGTLVEGASEIQYCDAENFEILLRILRAATRPTFAARPAVELPLFLAHREHLAEPGEGEEGVRRALEPLLGHPMPAAMWETEILPARVRGYRKMLLDAVLQESDLRWVGAGEKEISFLFENQTDLVRAATCAADDEVGRIFPSPVGRYTFTDLLTHTGTASSPLTKTLWDLAWRGCITNDSMESLRGGITSKFRAPAAPKIAVGSRRRGFRAWKSTRPFPGHWYCLPDPEPARDLLEEEELQRERVRLLLDRYGILFRELLQHEAPPLRWAPLFRTMRLMELAGEVTAGHFFEGIPGLQFVAPDGLETLQRGLPEDAIYGMNATDPASLCGVNVVGLKETLPSRLASTHIVFYGVQPVVVTRKTGKDWEIRVAADHADLSRYLAPFHNMLSRDFNPVPSFAVETINGDPATRSPYLPAFREVFDVTVEPRRVTLWQRTG